MVIGRLSARRHARGSFPPPWRLTASVQDVHQSQHCLDLLGRRRFRGPKERKRRPNAPGLCIIESRLNGLILMPDLPYVALCWMRP